MNSFMQGDLLIIKQAAILLGFEAATVFVADEPKVAVYLGEDKERNTLKILVGAHKWLAKPKDCVHYNKFVISRRKYEQNNNKISRSCNNKHLQ